MKIAYAFRRTVFYPHRAGVRDLPHGPTRQAFLAKIRETGFDSIELGLDSLGGLEAAEQDVLRLRDELHGHGLSCVALRAGGGLSRPDVAAQNTRRLEKAVEVAGLIGARVVNTALATPPRDPRAAGAFVGERVSQGSSRMASEDDFQRTAAVLKRIGRLAGDSGMTITIEVHQHAIADNSWSTLHLLELTGSPHVFANPDLGNIYWTYDEPEETAEEAIVALAPHAGYWHCKNLHRVHIPENRHSIFIRVPLPDGDIDYRFAIAAMVDAGFDGYLAIEGATQGDQLEADQRSLEYARRVLAQHRRAGV